MILDPQTKRCLKELKDSIKMIEEGKVVLRHYHDELVDEQGLHRKISIRMTFVGTTLS